MATLLHIDSSLFPADASASRAVTRVFRETWQERNPGNTVVYRDLTLDPAPHITADAHLAGLTDPAGHTPEQASALAARLRLVTELETADAVLIGAPMYNYTIPSTLKAWLDNVILPGRTAGGTPSSKGTPVTVVASRGGSYAPGTPKENFEYVRNYLTAVLADVLALDVDFIVPELTMAPHNPAMTELVPLFEKSRDQAFQDAAARATLLTERLGA
ncbi:MULTISPECIES: NAD(P)H-dependent oxidoreductase [Streptomyces]|uniref:FMN-dependent NADH-azoreductase n=1 Tax=Streptomyces TaxID=1883 RepID=UPI00240E35B4|nr:MULTISPECIES: NAD(P)H-dependent oxidoreductase [Streptomyces]WFB88490.1 NAD(P)H-dependent oxidoreductase [Streptomyces olivaceus]WGK50933.1 NAD(P)H-dependent oxidoreductase [Streptomyces sp. B146]